jgi:S-adenosylmethionine decarboxylase
LANLLLFSLLACIPFSFGALAVHRPLRAGWLARWRERAQQRHSVATPPPPRVVSEGGWTTIYCEDAIAFNEWLGKDEIGLPSDPGEIPSLGSHLLIELYGCFEESLRHETQVGDAMRKAAEDSKATVVAQSFHEFKPYGVSGAVIIQESHYTIHTWPEHRYAAVDLFYCGGSVQVHRAVEALQQEFQPERIRFLVIRRGLQSEVDA